ncbi:Asp-tRNA(Asn)/Glu-tRNA(Gln) amidotransferase subunit GatC [Alkaliphilus serpentinus]|uniref:Aspartyl/glutamyl-tRNA(Asn/Gln) amidotransferase subunit C n=1 Tax=Alkaliphilus serpentinus TaxID=1482731 RepID=A0A833HQV7_9FIRM|nr:Asp-tRNA(Asn)/Glu-tRNA(Gln) amidotransferase subunit GatC [Alkaliphilus serpentinus]KAB3532473.1 Asp-tRNA(Asn)/Glu-tRNA(Gln) amidotransferase subunit GatC [Alkaliphilus serpentinus]
MKISKEEVHYIAKLAKLHLTEEEADKMTEDFEKILSNFDAIRGVDVEGIMGETFKTTEAPHLRKDEERVFEDKKKLFQNTLDLKEGYIKVPKIIE